MAGKPAHQPLQLQDAERGQDLSGSQAGAGDQLVDADGMVVEVAEQGAFLIGKGQFDRVADGGLVRGGVDLANQRAKLLEDVVDRLDQAGSVADQAVAAAAGQAVHGSGYGKDLAVLLHRMVGGGERPAPRRRLDDHHAQAKAGNYAISLGKEARQGSLAHRQLAQNDAVPGDLAGKLGVLGWVDLLQPVGQDGDGAAAGLECPLWAAASMPRARPETIVNPVRASDEARRSAILIP